MDKCSRLLSITNITFAVTDFNITAVVLLFVNFVDISHNVFGVLCVEWCTSLVVCLLSSSYSTIVRLQVWQLVKRKYVLSFKKRETAKRRKLFLLGLTS